MTVNDYDPGGPTGKTIVCFVVLGCALLVGMFVYFVMKEDQCRNSALRKGYNLQQAAGICYRPWAHWHCIEMGHKKEVRELCSVLPKEEKK